MRNSSIVYIELLEWKMYFVQPVVYIYKMTKIYPS